METVGFAIGDGLHWQFVNDGKRGFPEYHGHSSIVRGRDNRYYLVGNRSDEAPDINFWVSDDLIRWAKQCDYTPDLSHVPNYPHPLARIGAPKLYFDKPSAQFVLTWHTPSVPGAKEDPERYWASQRTLYVTSPDLEHFFDPPRRLFSFEMATIDVIVRPNPDGGYVAVLKMSAIRRTSGPPAKLSELVTRRAYWALIQSRGRR